MLLNTDQRDKGIHMPNGIEAIDLGFTTDFTTSHGGHKFCIESKRKTVISNQGNLAGGMYTH
jgi:hypothetical protein